jgi:hypothetical protein
MSAANDWDHRIIDTVSHSLGGEIGRADDTDRLLASVKAKESARREQTLAEIAVAFIRWSQDLKQERK